ncbi:Chemotaxis protein CheA [uncultured Defluviicoccus sp.]|uniref:Chemotaxis protein CheA n=1 Tax=metagenome TaxID=256318 RepID=A0A380T7B5_9ZZZZ|nr:Chemotaxis protein CheA [uncultured Defluviicoccus sp.]
MDALEAIKVTFFQECEELLGELEAGLLALQAGEGDDETVNAVFRAVHSVKGGAGAFALEALVRFAHTFETTLDKVRSGSLKADDVVLKVLLRATDVLADLVQAAKTDATVDPARTAESSEDLEALWGAGEGHAAPASAAADASGDDDFGFTPIAFAPLPVIAPAGPPKWTVWFKPSAATYAKGNDAVLLLRELERLGACEVALDASTLPSFDALGAEDAWFAWTITITTDEGEAAIREVFDFVTGDCEWRVTAEAPPALALPELPALPLPSLDLPPLAPPSPPLPVAAAAEPETRDVPPADGPADPHPKAKTATAAAAPTIRVDLERVDKLIDLVGELVINQAMLAQRVGEIDLTRASNVQLALESLEQLTREIQDSVMAIRAQPVKSVFQRMPRLVRETALATSKQVRLITEGEGTEVDKTVIERLSDPITHMLRNAIDHGLETPDVRVAAGKPAEGTVCLSAFHRSGRIVIEVSDDGKGINRTRVRELAIERGLIAADASLTDDEVDNLIFLPGFSTAKEVSDLSGRGVGLDVVKRSIQSLGGRISIASKTGQGSTFTMSLPLTLAVLDGMVVSVGEQTLIAPLAAIVETLKPKKTDIRRLGTGMLLAVRDAIVPLLDVGVALGWRSEPIDPTTGVVLLVETEVGGCAALLVDAIQGQRQVVIKSLEQNFQRVESIAAATILGDGRVALIIDIDFIVGERRVDAEADGQPRLAPNLAKAS